MTDRAQLHPLSDQPSSGRHAVVIGSGLAGLLAARVLVDHFDQVTILDRDRFPDKPEHRKGTPQSFHAHGLPLRGREIIDELFPGIEADLGAAGASTGRDSVPFQVVSPFGPLPSRPQPGEFIMYSRFLLEWAIRARLTQYSQLRLLPEAEAVGLDTSLAGTGAANGRVTGVQVRYRKGAGEGVLAADLVVDASGRGSKAPQWLATLGYGEVEEEVITSGIGYASRFYAKPDQFPTDWTGLVINGRVPRNPRAGLILTIENGQWHVTLGGYANAAPPTDEAGFMQWARDLPDPTIYEAIRVARPLTPIRGYRTPTNRLRHFERVARWPAGFVVTGDAVCAFNPLYGQGITVSAMDALVLRQCLQGHSGGARAGFEQAFQRRLAKNVATPWFVASTEDLRWPGVQLQGAPPRRGTALVRRYLDLVLRAAVRDAYLTEKYLSLIMMTAHPRVLFAPGVLARVARVVISGKAGIPTQPFALSSQALAMLRRLPSADPPNADAGQQLPANSLSREMT
ncbi:MAG: FAD-dependent oxidoreductase [Pseudonocardiaceae bacterium]